MRFAAAVVVALVLAPASSAGRRPWEAGELVRLATKQKVAVLTLDGGGNAVGAWTMLATLDREQVPATFFLTGRFVQRYPQLARAIGSRYAVANHTYDHAHLPALSSTAVRTEIARTTGLIRARTGRDPRPIFRFPYGDRDARTLAIVHSLGYTSYRWTVDTLGWKGRAQTTDGAVRQVLANLEPGAIILMHVGAASDGSTVDTRALAQVIRAVRAHGYRFVALPSIAPR